MLARLGCAKQRSEAIGTENTWHLCHASHKHEVAGRIPPVSRAKPPEALRQSNESSSGMLPKSSSFRAAQFCELFQNDPVAIRNGSEDASALEKRLGTIKPPLKRRQATLPHAVLVAHRSSCVLHVEVCDLTLIRIELPSALEPRNVLPRRPREASESFCALARFWVSVVCFCELGAACSSPRPSE